MQKVVVKYLKENIEVEIDGKESVDDLKKKLAEKIQILPERQRLVYRGGILSDGNRTMQDLDISEGAVIYAIKTEPEPREKRDRSSPPTGLQQQMLPDMHVVAKDPGMKKILKNPEVMKGLLDMFPEMKKENPELKKLMESSHMLEEMAKIAEDPEYMNTQMKNVDIAMAKLETIPGGFNMLRGMLKTQKDPGDKLAEGGGDSGLFSEGSSAPSEEKNPAPNPWREYNFNPLLEYRRQAAYMRECGFKDTSVNIRLLVKHKGDVDEAISEILTVVHSPPDNESTTRR